MTQLAKVIDVSETFIPVDPNAFPENMSFTIREDYPTRGAPIVPYEGYNFMPTSYGYKSYFGTDNILSINALTSRCDEVFIVQTNTFENILVALCEDGIWTKRGESAGAWVQEVVLPIADDGTHSNWSYCSIGNDTYCYRAGGAYYYHINPATDYYTNLGTASGITNLTVTPTLLAGAGLVAGTYSVSVAYKDSIGRLSLPTAVSNVTLVSAGYLTIKWDRLAAAINGYRVYITFNNTTLYVDVAQNATLGGTLSYMVSGTGTPVALPELTSSIVQYTAYAIRSGVPTFLNMVGQIGIFKAGGRLGFFDSANSVAWSSIDVRSDFTPSIETLAGSAIFTQVQGRIVSIRPHGEGFVIYSTKSIVYVRQDVSATFQWNPIVVLSKSGVTYPFEVAVAQPDNIHYAWTTSGLYEITGGIAKLIIPEVVDFLKEANDPVYLRMLGGRYLFFGIVDPVYINGLVQFSTSQLPSTTFAFPTGKDYTLLANPVTLTGVDVCTTLGGIQAGNTTQQQAAGETARVAAAKPAKQAGTFYQPMYTAYFSSIGGASTAWDFGHVPVTTIMADGTEAEMCPPPSAGGLSSSAGTGTANHIAVAESFPGQWTIDRFISAQEAIWANEDAGRKAFLAKVTGRAKSNSATTAGVSACVASSPTHEEALIGRFIAGASGRDFGYSQCSFWLTRFVDSLVDVKRVRSVTTVCTPNDTSAELKWWTTGTYGIGNSIYASEMIAVEAIRALIAANPAQYTAYTPSIIGTSTGVNPGHTWLIGHDNVSNNDMSYNVIQGRSCAAVPSTQQAITYVCPIVYNKIVTVNAYNKAVPVTSVPIPDTGFCVLTGWRYTDINGATQTLTAGACALPTVPSNANTGPGSTTTNGIPSANPTATNGTVCSIPFTPITLPAIQATPITWPPQTTTLPGGSFLLQKGSIGPIYPTLAGALVYDTQLKKWGKMKLNYKQLLDYSPINSSSGAIIDQDVFGIEAGVLVGDGTISKFDSAPTNSYIKYGKIGYYRLGMTTTEEAKIAFRTPSTGIFSVETSLDGRTIENMIGMSGTFTNALNLTLNGGSTGRWHNIKISGNYDITHLQYRGVVQGRR